MTDRSRRAAAAALAIRILTAACAAAAEAPQAPPADDLATAHAERFAAMVAGDLDALAPMLADELTYAHSDGRVETREQFLASLAGGGLVYLAIASEGESALRRYGDGEVGVITGAARLRVRLGEREGEMTLRYTSVYVLRDGRWRLAAWHSSPIRP
jgi:hypothetical protein